MRRNVKKSASIQGVIHRIFILTVALFAVLCAFIYWSVRRIITANLNEYMEISEQRLLSSLDTMYDKIENYATIMSGDEKMRRLLKNSYPEKTQYVSYFNNQNTYYRILEPDIVDTALVSDNMYYLRSSGQ